MKRLFVVLFVVTLALALSSCAPAPSSTGGAAATSAPAAPAAAAATSAPAAPAAGGTIKIGVQGPMTGDMAQEGLGFKNAVQLLVDQTNAAGGINGQQIELFVEDDRGDPKEASLVADRLISQGVIAVIGGYNSTATEPASAIYNKAGVLQITPGATAVRLSEHGYNQFFRTCFLDDKQAVFAADFLVKEMGYKNIAVLHDNTTYAQGLAEATKTSLEALGVTPVFYDAINPDDTDFSPGAVE